MVVVVCDEGVISRKLEPTYVYLFKALATVVQDLCREVAGILLLWVKVKGHYDEINNKADNLATDGRVGLPRTRNSGSQTHVLLV